MLCHILSTLILPSPPVSLSLPFLHQPPHQMSYVTISLCSSWCCISGPHSWTILTNKTRFLRYWWMRTIVFAVMLRISDRTSEVMSHPHRHYMSPNLLLYSIIYQNILYKHKMIDKVKWHCVCRFSYVYWQDKIYWRVSMPSAPTQHALFTRSFRKLTVRRTWFELFSDLNVASEHDMTSFISQLMKPRPV